MSEVHPITFRLKVYNAWRRGNDAPQPDPKTVGEDIDSICDIAKRLERERDAERALADRLAEAIQNYLVLDENIDATTDELNGSWEHLQSSLTAWKEARSD